MSEPPFRSVQIVGAAVVAVGLVGAVRGEPLSALPPVVGATEVFAADELTGLGLHGFDPVSYFLGPAPRAGQAGLELIWSGLAWRFASDANRAAFESEPAAYAPRLGGYDAMLAAEGRLAPANPNLFSLRAGRLYLFRSDRARARFLADPSIAAKAEAQWPALKGGLVQP